MFYIWAPFFGLLVRQVHTRPVQHARLVYIFFIYIHIYIYIYVYIRRACWTGSRVNLVTKIQKYPPKCFVRKLFTLLGFFSIWGGVDFFDFLGSIFFLTMSPYRVQYTESESDIKNYNFLYRNTQQTKML